MPRRPVPPAPVPVPADAGAPAPEQTYRRRPWLSSYPPSVPPGVDVPAVPLPGLLDDAAERHPEAVALVFLGAETTYGELRRQVDAFAGALAGLGVGRGDRVALVLPDCPQLVVSCFAALRLGAVVAPHDPLTPAPELGRRLGESGATVAVCHDRAYPTVAAARDRSALRHVVVTSLADALPRRTRLALRLPIARARRARADLTAAFPEGEPVRRLVDLVRRPGRAVGQVELDPARDVALLAWTDGDSSPARAVVLTHAALVANAVQVAAWLAPVAAVPPVPPVVLGGLPLWHPHGLTTCLTATVLAGGTLVLLPDSDPRGVLGAVAEHRPTVLPGVPTLFAELLEALGTDRHDLTGVRVAVCVGRGLPQQVQERFERLSGGRLVEAHGLVETGLTHAQPVTGARRPGTAGLPLPGTRAVILDRDDPTCAVPVTVAGELAVTGPQLSAGYWRRPGQTRATATADGHHRTGVVAAMHEDGTFALLGPALEPAPDAGPAGGPARPPDTPLVAPRPAGPPRARSGPPRRTPRPAPDPSATRARPPAPEARTAAPQARTAAQRRAAQPPSPQPRTAQPRTAQPRVPQPGASPQPGTGAQRRVPKPGASPQPRATQPRAAQPRAAQPWTTQARTTQPRTTQRAPATPRAPAAPPGRPPDRPATPVPPVPSAPAPVPPVPPAPPAPAAGTPPPRPGARRAPARPRRPASPRQRGHAPGEQ